MHHQIVDAQHLIVGQHQLLDLVDKFLVGCLTQQGGDGLAGGLHGGVEDEEGHQQPHIAVQRQVGKEGGDHAQQHGDGGDGVAEAVLGGGGHGGGADLAAHGAVIKGHVHLHQHGQHQNGGGNGGELHRLGVEDFIEGGAQQFHAHHQDEARHHQTGDILHASVAEGMVGVGLLTRQTETQQRHHRGEGIGEVVKGVGGDGDGAGQRACQQLADAEDDVQHHTHDAAEGAPGAAHRLVGGIGVVFDKETAQQRDHTAPPGMVRLMWQHRSSRSSSVAALMRSLPPQWSQVRSTKPRRTFME